MNKLKEEYLSYIDGKIAEHNNLSEQYKSDDRKDESDLEKVKTNIYEVFKILFLSDIKHLEGKDLGGGKDKNLYNNFLNRFDTIPANWKESRDKAIEHGDTAKQIIEETKLAVAGELRDIFENMFI